MARPHVEFIFSQALAWTLEGGPPGRERLPHKTLSSDPVLKELTAIVQFPAGWSAMIESGFQEEIYVLDGMLRIGGINLGRDGYFRVAPSMSEHWMAPSGAVALIFLNRVEADSQLELVSIDTTLMPWDRTGVPPELDYMGIARKALFVDSDTGRHRTWLLSTGPQIVPSGAALAIETHSCAEEVFMLSGDITGPQGAMTPGAYFWRPRDTYHGPFGSRNGSLALSRFRHGEQNTTFHALTKPFSFDAPYRPDLPPEMAELALRMPTEQCRY
jgi:hypothetical protein